MRKLSDKTEERITRVAVGIARDLDRANRAINAGKASIKKDSKELAKFGAKETARIGYDLGRELFDFFIPAPRRR